RRAFQLAGARTVVMSLWSVPDKETVTLMTDFYRRMQAGRGKARALQEASLALMNERKRTNGCAHPLFWGAFVCVGEP
ncbi:CHAT domain-containing protein, partial [Gemmatimonadota bacterium]